MTGLGLLACLYTSFGQKQKSSVGPVTMNVVNGTSSSAQDDASLIQQAEALFAEERLLQAVKLLRQVNDTSLLQPNHEWMIQWADAIEDGIKDLLLPASAEGTNWKKQTESHGHRDFTVHYQVTEDNHLVSRIDSIVESSLLVPMLSVFNESDLYKTWTPSFTKPVKMGISQSKKLKEAGRGNQVIQITAKLAWPFSTRESTHHAVSVDAIDDEGLIAIRVQTQTHEENPDIPKPLPGVVRVDLSCYVAIRGCPPDHQLLEKSGHKYPPGEELFLFSMKVWVDAHVAGIPLSLINWVSRTVFGRVWANLLGVAEGVRDGTRPLHQEKIAENKKLYDWIEERAKVMVEKVKKESEAFKVAT